MPTLEGLVTVVQEGRFLLTTDDGKAHLMLLSYRAAAEPDQLHELQRVQARVRVFCKEAPDLLAYVAYKAQIISP